MADFDEAIRLDPTFAAAFNNRGHLWHQNKRDLDRAMADYDEAIRLDPTFAAAFNNRGHLWHQNKRDLDRAMADYDEAIRLDPSMAPAYLNRGIAFKEKGDLDRAMADFNDGSRINHGCAEAFINRGIAWREKGNNDQALADFDEAIRLESKNAYAHCNRASLRASCPDERFRDGQMAVEDAKVACELRSWKEYWSLSCLAAAYAELGEFDEAVETQRKAIDLAPDADKKPLRYRLDLFQAGKPYRKAPVKR